MAQELEKRLNKMQKKMEESHKENSKLKELVSKKRKHSNSLLEPKYSSSIDNIKRKDRKNGKSKEEKNRGSLYFHFTPVFSVVVLFVAVDIFQWSQSSPNLMQLMAGVIVSFGLIFYSLVKLKYKK